MTRPPGIDIFLDPLTRVSAPLLSKPLHRYSEGMVDEDDVKPILWVGSSKRDLMDMPSVVRSDFGYGLHQAQIGEFPDSAKPLTGFGGASVIELLQDHRVSLNKG